MSGDKAGKTYWEQCWEHAPSPSVVDPRAKGLNHYVNRKLHEFFLDTFSGMPTEGKTLLEIGCANSSWLPYFSKEFGFRVCGVDYTAQGCQQERQILTNEGVKGEVICCDFFCPPQSMRGAFDVVVSFGVVEHFEDTAGCLRAFSEFLKPGGLLFTNIPNMAGLIGSIQKLVNRPVFDIHVPLDDRALAAAHQASLDVQSCRYFLFANWNVVNVETWERNISYQVFVRLRSWISKGCWVLECFVPGIRPNRLTSPYIICVARKPCASLW